MKKLVIDADGAHVERGSYETSVCPLWACLKEMDHPGRLEIPLVSYPGPEFIHEVSPPIPTLEEAVNDILRKENAELRRELDGLKSGWRPNDLQSATQYARAMRENADLRATIGRMREVNERLTEANTHQLRQNEGLRNDVRQAEEHYEAASKRLEQLRSRMDAVGLVLQGKDQIFGLIAHSPMLELAREVVAKSTLRWRLYEETMARLAALGKEVELIRRQSNTNSDPKGLYEPPW